MFPFRFDYVDDVSSTNFIEEHIRWEEINTRLSNSSQWKYKKGKNYNTQTYFYDYARDVLFNQNDSFNQNDFSATYLHEKIKGGGGKYIVKLKFKTEKDMNHEYKFSNATYTLSIKKVQLQVFKSGVGVLSLHLEYYGKAELNNDIKEDLKERYYDILRINDYGRRIYPAFLDDNGSTEKAKEEFLPLSITITYPEEGQQRVIKEDFSDSSDAIGKYIMEILDTEIFSNAHEKGKYHLKPSLDDRMFVMGWYGTDKIERSNYTDKNDFWYRYLYVDHGTSASITDAKMREELLSQSTYTRWKGKDGTLWGITRYSCMVFTDNYAKLKKEQQTFIIDHFGEHYFYMMTLLLATRTSILRFSDEISTLISAASAQSDYALRAKHTEKLYQHYLDFYNRLYFKEITHQDQGIELYDLGLRQMKVEDHIGKLDNKFTKLFEFNHLKAEEEKVRAEKDQADRQNTFNTLLTWFGALFVLPSLVLGLLGLDMLKPDASHGVFLGVYLPVILSAVSGYLLLSQTTKRWLKGVGFVLMLVLFAYIYFQPRVFVATRSNDSNTTPESFAKASFEIDSNASKPIATQPTIVPQEPNTTRPTLAVAPREHNQTTHKEETNVTTATK
jgi:hypothetical protein